MPARDIDLWLNVKARDRTAGVFDAVKRKANSVFERGRRSRINGVTQTAIRGVKSVTAVINPMVKRVQAMIQLFELWQGTVSDTMRSLSAGAAGVAAEIELVAQRVKESRERVDAENELIAANSVRVWGALRITVAETFEDMQRRAFDWSAVAQKAATFSERAFLGFLGIVDKATAEMDRLRTATEIYRIQWELIKNFGDGDFRRNALKRIELVRAESAEARKLIEATGFRAKAEERLAAAQRDLANARRTAQEQAARQGQSSNIGSTSNPQQPGEVENARAVAAEVAKIETEKQQALTDIYKQMGETRLASQAEDHMRYVQGVKSIYTEYANSLRNAEQLAADAAVAAIEKRKQVLSDFQSFLSNFSSVFTALASIDQTNADKEQVRSDAKLSRLKREREALIKNTDEQGVQTKREAQLYRDRLQGYSRAEDRIKQRQERAQRDAQRSAKKFVVLQSLVSVASAHAAAVKSMTGVGPNPVAMGLAFTSVLGTALTGVAAIKKACAQIGAGGGGGASTSGAGGGTTGGGGSGDRSQPQQAQQLTDRPPVVQQESSIIVNVPLDDARFYSASQMRMILDSLRLYGAIA